MELVSSSSKSRNSAPLITNNISSNNHNNINNINNSSSSSIPNLHIHQRRSLALNDYNYLSSQSSILSFYSIAPQHEITLSDFEESAYDRVQLLKSIEGLRAKRGLSGKNMNLAAVGELNDNIAQLVKKYRLNDIYRDNLSHFVLRLAYSKTEELRRWLITQECHLFRHRFETENNAMVNQFLAENNLEYEPVPEEDIAEIRDKLRAIPANHDSITTVYYKVEFEEAFDLVRERKVYLENGYAYVSRNNLINLILNKFRAHLSQQLAITFRYTQQQKTDERIKPLINSLAKQSLGANNYKTSHVVEGAVTREQLPFLAQQSFPLCMSTLYNGLKADHHLKHGGRMQLGLFLKGIGLSLQDALLFWKQSFARKTPPEKFDKDYAYGVRHNYGKEGKRVQYNPYGCMKIINSIAGQGEHHGCPFKQSDESTLRVMLKNKNCDRNGIEEVIQLVNKQHYQVACVKLFALTHNNYIPDTIGNHPNSYFDASIKFHKELSGSTVKQETQNITTDDNNTSDTTAKEETMGNENTNNTTTTSSSSTNNENAEMVD